MNNRIELSNTGGFPFDQDTLGFMQNGYSFLEEMTKAISGTDSCIVSGCNVIGANTSAGVVIINGELLPFEGGITGSKVAIIETVEEAEYEDLVLRPVYKQRKVSFSVTGLNWSDFKRITPLNAIMPTGLITMWSGAIGAIPAGWALCDGQNGTPNLSGKFIVGYNSADTDYNDIGKTGGAKSVTLTSSQSGVGPHSHAINDPGHTHQVDVSSNIGWIGAAAGSGNFIGQNQTEQTGITINSASANAQQAHENRPPYYTLAYIIKL